MASAELKLSLLNDVNFPLVLRSSLCCATPMRECYFDPQGWCWNFKRGWLRQSGGPLGVAQNYQIQQ